jgi:hypothetical protein
MRRGLSVDAIVVFGVVAVMGVLRFEKDAERAAVAGRPLLSTA